MYKFCNGDLKNFFLLLRKGTYPYEHIDIWERFDERTIPPNKSFLQFVIDGFSASYRLDRNCLGGGLMLFVREDIPSNLLTIEEKPIESFYVELNLRNSKWLVNCSYNPHKNSIGNHLDRIS